jgi:hypothetical protein
LSPAAAKKKDTAKKDPIKVSIFGLWLLDIYSSLEIDATALSL